jgi:hypothetical protein
MAKPQPFRPLLPRERELLDLLLAEEFPGVRELRIQAESVEGRPWNGLATLVELTVTDPLAPRAKVKDRVPVEAELSGVDPPQELLLHVVGGLLETLELVSDDGDDPTELPGASAFERPWTKPV